MFVIDPFLVVLDINDDAIAQNVIIYAQFYIAIPTLLPDDSFGKDWYYYENREKISV